jgi:hypothetical protein
MRRGAEGQTDQGSCLFEPQASLHETPAGLSTTGCPQRSGGTQAPGSPSLLLTLLLAKQQKSESPAAATERLRNLAENPADRNRIRLRRAQPERWENLIPNSRTEFGSGRFEGQSTNSPNLRLALRVLRFASQGNCDLTLKTRFGHASGRQPRQTVRKQLLNE